MSIDCKVKGSISSLGICTLAVTGSIGLLAVSVRLLAGSIFLGDQGASSGEKIPIDEKSGSAF